MNGAKVSYDGDYTDQKDSQTRSLLASEALHSSAGASSVQLRFEHDEQVDIDLSLAPPSSLLLYVYVVLVSLAAILFGFEISIISGAKEQAATEFGFGKKSMKYATLASSMTIGAIPGSATAGLLQDWIGRKATVVLACVIYIAGAAVEFFSHGHSFEMLLTGRIVVGLGVGWLSSTVPMYIAELSPAHIRGMLVTSNQLNICIGILLGYLVDAFVTNWWVQLGCGILLAAPLILSFLFVTPMSPRWLAAQGRFDDSRKVLLSIRGEHETAYVGAELGEIQKSLETTNHGWERLREPAVFRSVVVGCVLGVFQQITGVNAINAYAPDVLQAAGFDKSKSKIMAIFIGVVKVVLVAIAMMLMDRLGRKTMLLAGTTGMIVCMVALSSILLHFDHANEKVPKAWGMISAVCLWFYMAFFEISLGPVLWLLLSEMFPLEVRGTAMALGSSTNWIFVFVVLILFVPLEKAISIYGLFYLYSAIGVAAIVFTVYYVPETKGKTLEEIEDVFREAVGEEKLFDIKKRNSGKQQGDGQHKGVSLEAGAIHDHGALGTGQREVTVQ